MNKSDWCDILVRHAPVWLVLAGGIAISATGYFAVDRAEHERASITFENAANERIFAIQQVLDSNIQVLRSIGSLFDASREVDESEFRAFVEPLLTRLKSFQALEFAPKVLHSERATFEAEIRERGHVGFEIKDRGSGNKMVRAAERADYFPLLYVEPLAGNEVVLGYDIGSDDTRRAIFQRALEEDAPIATRQTALIQGGGTVNAVIVSHPVYRALADRKTRDDRVRNVAGFVVGVMRIDKTIGRLYDEREGGRFTRGLGIDLYIYDRALPRGRRLLYVHAAGTRKEPAPRLTLDEAQEGLDVTREITFAGRRWAVVARPADSKYEHGNAWMAPAALAVLLAFTLLLTRYVYVTARRRQLVEILVARREQELRESEARTTIVVDNVADGIISIDARGIVRGFNRAAERTFGIMATDMIGKNIKHLMPQPDRDHHDGYIANYIETGQKRIIGRSREVSGCRADGTEFPMEIAVSEAWIAGERVFVGIVRDITERKRTESALIRRTSLVNLMHQITVAANEAKNLRDAIQISLDMVCAYTRWPVGHVYLRGQSDRETLVSLDIWHLDDDSYAPFREMSNGMTFAIGRGMPGRVAATGMAEWLAENRQASEHPRRDAARAVGLRAGFGVPVKVGAEVVAVLEFFSKENSEPDDVLLQALTSIGAQVGRVLERIKVDRLKDEFVSTVSHELRTPMTSIRGSLGLIRGGAVAGEKAKDLVEIAYKNSERLVRLINDILDVEKIEAGKMDFRFGPVGLRTFVEEAVAANRAYGDSYDVSIALDGEVPDLTIRGDADRLMQVFANLFSNAVKFSPAGGLVRIRVAPSESGFARLSVSDDGPGIPLEFQPRIFGKFAQADGSDSRRLGGTGLGLSIVKLIVERHGGKVEFDSAVGCGTTFHVDLPLWQDAPVKAMGDS